MKYKLKNKCSECDWWQEIVEGEYCSKHSLELPSELAKRRKYLTSFYRKWFILDGILLFIFLIVCIVIIGSLVINRNSDNNWIYALPLILFIPLTLISFYLFAKDIKEMKQDFKKLKHLERQWIKN